MFVSPIFFTPTTSLQPLFVLKKAELLTKRCQKLGRFFQVQRGGLYMAIQNSRVRGVLALGCGCYYYIVYIIVYIVYIGLTDFHYTSGIQRHSAWVYEIYWNMNQNMNSIEQIKNVCSSPDSVDIPLFRRTRPALTRSARIVDTTPSPQRPSRADEIVAMELAEVHFQPPTGWPQKSDVSLPKAALSALEAWVWPTFSTSLSHPLLQSRSSWPPKRWPLGDRLRKVATQLPAPPRLQLLSVPLRCGRTWAPSDVRTRHPMPRADQKAHGVKPIPCSPEGLRNVSA